MSHSATDSMPRGRSWRNIRQEVTPHALSSRGRKRRHRNWLKSAALGAFIIAAVWGIHWTAVTWSDRAALARAVHSPKLAEPVLITDGVLPQKWVKDALALPAAARLMSLDLAALRARLLAQGQVQVAVLTRSFPDTLVVTLRERNPVARLQVQDGAGAPAQLLVARDGTVYEGVNYDPEMIATLPWLAGFTLKRQGTGYAPIAGMDAIAGLLATAQTEAAWLYRDWIVVSLARLASHDEIAVKSQDVGGHKIEEIVFSRKQDYYKQIARLDYILEQSRDRVDRLPVRVDLTLGGQATVQFDGEVQAQLPVAPSRAFFDQQPPSVQPKARRDF